MKEKLQRVREWVRVNKKRSIGIAVAVLFLIGGISAAAVAGSMNTNAVKTAQTDKKVAAQTNTQKKTTDIKKTETEEKRDTSKEEKAEETAEEAAAETEEAADTQSQKAASVDTNAATQKTASSSSSGTSGTSSSGGSSQTSTNNSSSSKPAHTHDWQPQYSTEQKWVVDKAAWTETKSEPIYENVPVMKCNDCGAYLNANNCWDHIENHAINGGKGSWTDTYESQQTGTNTYTVNHPEEGHYESYSVLTGYKCSCGATK